MIPALMAIDVGTSHSKVGLYRVDGDLVKVSSHRTQTLSNQAGQFYYQPDDIWRTIASGIREVLDGDGDVRVLAIAIASMAESGVMVHRQTGVPLSECIPWFDRRSSDQAEWIVNSDRPFARFSKSGLHPSFKCGLAKVLWLFQNTDAGFSQGVWLSLADYIAFRLTHKLATDYSLAARTLAFRIDTKEWDTPWIASFKLPKGLFPDAYPAGTVIGKTHAELDGIGLRPGIPVSIAGHDHICASLGLGATRVGDVYDSMGTAETLCGTLEERELGEIEYQSGLAYSCSMIPGQRVWIGGLPSSGGAVDWMRTEWFSPPATYEELREITTQFRQSPTGILFYPYLVGAGAPLPDPSVSGAFIGLTKSHTKIDVVKAVLEGTAYEMESIRARAEAVSGRPIKHMMAVGGGARLSAWLQIKSNVSGCRIDVSDETEATLRGAALFAGISAQVYRDFAEATRVVESRRVTSVYEADQALHEAYQNVYAKRYQPVNQALREIYQRLS
ncbi:FGGY-family carbohydrate kinase [Alicyclobacillus fastidiosus]|uniref:FGGY family carbohydrate kinase n=1 Tax=Alicyclobacillus fastidiosus TaxID=392011 RepID=A0ABV5ALS3_9BACL|nr:FGGY family carbohydrate kinase [Alicyclobacillus fastidiosus]WEH08043.1 FGGY family carbohydrate kinase [Alicyclobacillus fastidiosus]